MRLLTSGWETGDIREVPGSTNEIIGVTGINAVVNTAPTPRAGGNYCLRTTITAGGSGQVWRVFPISGNPAQVWGRVGLYFCNSVTATSEIVFLAVSDQFNVFQHCFTWSQTDHYIRLRSGGATSGTLLALSSATVAPGVWQTFEWQSKYTNSTSGETRVYVNDTGLITYTGDNSVSSSLTTGYVRLGIAGPSLENDIYVAFDDFAINDSNSSNNNNYSQVGDGRVILLRPTGEGSLTGWGRGGTDTGANWSQLSELPVSTNQTVTGSIYRTMDLYQMANPPSDTVQIRVVEAVYLAYKTDTAYAAVAPILQTGGRLSEWGTQVLTFDPTFYVTRWERDPGTPGGTGTWTASSLSALEAGVTVR